MKRLVIALQCEDEAAREALKAAVEAVEAAACAPVYRAWIDDVTAASQQDLEEDA